MNLTNLIALGFGVLLGVIHFFSEDIKPTEGRMRCCIGPFAAGIAIAYLFLELLPETFQAATYLKHWVFIFLLFGFGILHLIEKLIYQHAEKEKLVMELKEVHSISFFFYYFIIGIALEPLTQIITANPH